MEPQQDLMNLMAGMPDYYRKFKKNKCVRSKHPNMYQGKTYNQTQFDIAKKIMNSFFDDPSLLQQPVAYIYNFKKHWTNSQGFKKKRYVLVEADINSLAYREVNNLKNPRNQREYRKTIVGNRNSVRGKPIEMMRLVYQRKFGYPPPEDITYEVTTVYPGNSVYRRGALMDLSHTFLVLGKNPDDNTVYIAEVTTPNPFVVELSKFKMCSVAVVKPLYLEPDVHYKARTREYTMGVTVQSVYTFSDLIKSFIRVLYTNGSFDYPLRMTRTCHDYLQYIVNGTPIEPLRCMYVSHQNRPIIVENNIGASNNWLTMEIYRKIFNQIARCIEAFDKEYMRNPNNANVKCSMNET